LRIITLRITGRQIRSNRRIFEVPGTIQCYMYDDKLKYLMFLSTFRNCILFKEAMCKPRSVSRFDNRVQVFLSKPIW